MQTRSARPSGRKRVAGLAAAVALGLGTALFGASPAMAAAPTLDPNPTPPVGWEWVTLTGTADPGADVVLYEQAYYFYRQGPSLTRATPYFPEDIVTARADGSGRYTLRRRLDSGFAFQVQAGSTRSNIITVPIVAKPSVSFAAEGNGVVDVHVLSEPNQGFLPVAIERRNGSAWEIISSGFADGDGVYRTKLTGQPAGVWEYRAAIGPEPENMVALGFSVVVGIDAGGTGTPPPPTTTRPPTTAPTTTPPTTTPPTTVPPTTTPATTQPTTVPPTTTRPTTVPPTTTRPTTVPPTTTKPAPVPTTKPPAPKPKPPVFTGPKAGDVKFTYAYYNAKGSDTRKNSSLNREYVRITNKTKKTINLKYWTIRDRAGNTYKFSGNVYLKPGKHIYLRTGKGKNTSTTRYWGRKSHVWNNGGDTAYLKSSTNRTIDTCKWGKGKGRTSC
jgi:hypothetical protein